MIGLLLLPKLNAAVVYWDINGTTAGAGGATPSGNWNTTGATNWNAAADGTGAVANWVAGDDAVFSAGTDATGAYTVTLGAAMNVGNMSFADGAATITGVTANTLTVAAGGSAFDVASGITGRIDALLAGTGAFTKTGSGVLILGGIDNNTQSGAFNINEGTVRGEKTPASAGNAGIIGNSSDLTILAGAKLEFNGNANYSLETVGTLSGAGNIEHIGTAGPIRFRVSGAASTTFSGIISDLTQNLDLYKITGAGTLTLTGANAYDGTTTISAGAINIQNATALGTTALGTTVDAGAALEIQNNISVGAEALSLAGTGVGNNGALRNVSGTNSYAGNITLTAATEIQSDAGALTISGGITGATFGLTFDGAGNTTVSGIIGTTSGTLTKNGAGTTTLSGANTYTGATTVSVGTLNIQNASALGTTAAGTTVASGAALEIQGGITTLAEALTLSGTGVSSNGALRNISGANTFAGTITLNAATEIQSDTDSLTLSAANAVTGTNQNLTVDGSGNTTISGTITTGSGTLTKSGTGTLYLTGAGNNTYTGATTINSGGAINIQKAQALGTTGAGTTVNSGGALEIQGGITTTAEALTLSGTGVSSNGALRNISGTNTYAGNVTLAAASEIQSDAGTLTVSGTIGGATQALTVDGAGNTTLNGVIGTTSGTLTKEGAGILTLGANNTYTGGTTINAGTVRVSADLRLGAAPGAATPNNVVFNGGTLETTATFTLNANRGVTVNAGGGTVDVNAGTTLTYNGILAGTGDFTKADTGTLILGGTTTNTHNTGAVNVNAGTLQINKTGGANRGIGDASAVTVATGATLQFNGGQSETIGSLAGGGTVNNSNATAITLTTGGNNASTTYSGLIQDTGGNLSLVKTGTGTQTLSGTAANTYAGTTSVNDGDLNLQKTAGLNAVGTGAITVGDSVGGASSANLVLLASNQIADAAAVTINSDGRFSTGNFTESIGTIAGTGLIDLSTSGYLTVGANNTSSTFAGSITGTGTLEKAGSGILTFNSAISYAGSLNLSGGTLRLNGIGVTVDTLTLTGNSTIDFAGTNATLDVTNLNLNGFTLNITNWANAVDYFYADNWTGAVLETRNAAPMNQVTFNGFTAADTKWQSYDLQITPVPEPSTYGALLLGSMMVFFVRRRRRG